jgi:hypothetical protein
MAMRQTRETRMIEQVLNEHFPDCPPEYPPAAYRYNPASIRIRIVNNRFKGRSLGERDDMVLPIIHTLPKKTQADILLMLLFTPDEAQESVATEIFEHGAPTRL